MACQLKKINVDFYCPISTTDVFHIQCCLWQRSAQKVRKDVLNRTCHSRYFLNVCLFVCSGTHYCLQEAVWESGGTLLLLEAEREIFYIHDTHIYCVIAHIFQNEHIHVFENTFI